MSKQLPPSRLADQFLLRFPDGLRDRIAEVAKANNRSMTAEIVDRLERSFVRDAGLHAIPSPSERSELDELWAFQSELMKSFVWTLKQVVELRPGSAREAKVTPQIIEHLDGLLARLPSNEAPAPRKARK